MSAVDRIRELLAKRASRPPWWVNRACHDAEHEADMEIDAALVRLDGEDDRDKGVPVTKEAPLAKGDVLASNPCEVTVTHSAVNDVGRREVWGRCSHCRIAHPIDWKLFERGRGPWVRVARAASDPECSR